MPFFRTRSFEIIALKASRQHEMNPQPSTHGDIESYYYQFCLVFCGYES